MKGTKAVVFCLSVCLIFLSLGTTAGAQARFDHDLWDLTYPNVVGTKLGLYGTDEVGGCLTCHGIHTEPIYNVYAEDIRAQLDAGATTLEAFVNVEDLDSDGDGASNITEIMAITYPADPNDYPPSTIEILSAQYDYVSDSLKVVATSIYGPDAALELLDYGPMKWKEKKGWWVLKVPDIFFPPMSVTVCGQFDDCMTVE